MKLISELVNANDLAAAFAKLCFEPKKIQSESQLTYNEAAQALYGSKGGEPVKPSEEELSKIRRNLFSKFGHDDDDENNESYDEDAEDEGSK